MGDEHIGRRISVETFEGTYTAIIHGVDSKNKKLILNKVSMADGRKLRGLQIFSASDIKNLSLLADEQPPGQEDLSSSPINGTADAEELKEKEASSEEENQADVKTAAKDPSDDGSRLIARKPMAPDRFIAGDDCLVTNVPEEEIQDPPEVVLVDEFGETFDSAIKYINEQRVVGLASDGENISRFGKLCLLTIGSRKYTYVFDVYKLGPKCFNDGLTSILQNRYLLKVIHDCRSLSDCLHHQYKTKIVNVFDSQVADIIIYKQKRGKLPRDVNGLLPCLLEYLNLKHSQCEFQTIVKGYCKQPRTWTTRPLPQELVNAVAQKVLYLRELKITQTENLLAEFLHGVDIYLDVFKNADEPNHNSLRGKRVPAAFGRLKNSEERRWKRYEQVDKKLEADERSTRDDKKTVEEGEGSLKGREPVWTEGTEFASSYRKRHGKIIERNDIGKDRMRMNGDYQKPEYKNGVSWDRIRKERGDSIEGAKSEEDITYRSESTVQQKKKQVGNDRSSPSVHNGTEVKELSDDKSYSNRTQNDEENVPSETLSFVKSKKLPVDWFDCDTPSTDRSRSSSIDAEIGAISKSIQKLKPEQIITPEIQRYRTTSNNSSYDGEFPSLSPENQKMSPKKPDQTGVGKNENVGNACRDLFGNRGVRNTNRTPEPRGRAKTRELNMNRAMNASPSSGMFSHLPKQFGMKNSFAFPSDNALLNTNPIIETDDADRIPGQHVKLQKITAK